MTLRFVKAEPFDDFNCKITCENRFLWFKPSCAEFVGNGTVWHSYPDGKRQPTHIEVWLCDLWRRWQWQEQRP